MIDGILADDRPISPELFRKYADNLRRAVDAVHIDDEDLSARWHANVSRFAAYKAYHATNEIRQKAKEEGGDLALPKAILHKYNRYQAAEYNTAVARARTGKQWQQFEEEDNRRLFPCIKWLPSRSATPREEHMPFYNRVWPKDDPFWLSNQPGTLWNCKCDWEQTDEDPTDGNPTSRIVKPGLDENPATSGQIFTDTAPYFKRAPKDIKIDDKTASELPSLQSLVSVNTKEYRLDYFSTEGGFLQTSRERIKEGQKNKQEIEKFGKEHSMCRTLASNDFNVTYRTSVSGSYDVTVNGTPADLKQVGSWKQIRHHASKAINQQHADIVVFEFLSESKELHLELFKVKKLPWMEGKKIMYYFKDRPHDIHHL